MFELTVRSSFAAAHRLREYDGKCENLHGHNWVVEVRVRAESLNDIGLAIDFKDLKAATDAVLDRLDHKLLNDVEPFKEMNPSSENIARWIFESLKERLGGLVVGLREVSVWENPNCCATYWE
ncbi:MAG TPA: 6-carboxytetrahydropterin synthase QueD [bacterium]|nr:6-carboxytetrahydropterin synthase QueD [bacterium]